MFHRKRFRLALGYSDRPPADNCLDLRSRRPLIPPHYRMTFSGIRPPFRPATAAPTRPAWWRWRNDARARPGSGGGTTPPSTGSSGGVSPARDRKRAHQANVIYPWPPPNAIVLHAATPIQLSQAGTGLRVYFISRDGTSTIGPFFDEFGILAYTYPNDPVTLYDRQQSRHRQTRHRRLPAVRKQAPRKHLLRRPPASRHQQTLRLHRRPPTHRSPRTVVAPKGRSPHNNNPQARAPLVGALFPSKHT